MAVFQQHDNEALYNSNNRVACNGKIFQNLAISKTLNDCCKLSLDNADLTNVQKRQ